MFKNFVHPHTYRVIMPPNPAQHTYTVDARRRDTSSSESWHTTRTEGTTTNMQHNIDSLLETAHKNMLDNNQEVTQMSGVQRSDALPPNGAKRFNIHDNEYTPGNTQSVPAQNYKEFSELGPGIWQHSRSQSNGNEGRITARAVRYNDNTLAAFSQPASLQPSLQPPFQPSLQPSYQPSYQSSLQPSLEPSLQPPLQSSYQPPLSDRQQQNPHGGYFPVSGGTKPKVAEPKNGEGSLAIERYLLEPPMTARNLQDIDQVVGATSMSAKPLNNQPDPSMSAESPTTPSDSSVMVKSLNNPPASSRPSGLGSSMLKNPGKRSMPPQGNARTNGPFHEDSGSEESGTPARKRIALDRPTSFQSRPVPFLQQTISPKPYPMPQPRTNYIEVESEMSRRLEMDCLQNIQRMPRRPPAHVVRIIHGHIDRIRADNRAKTKRRALPEQETFAQNGQFALPSGKTNPFSEVSGAPMTAGPTTATPTNPPINQPPTTGMYPMPPPPLPGKSTTTSGNLKRRRKLTSPELQELHEMQQRNARLAEEMSKVVRERERASIAGSTRDEDFTTKMAQMENEQRWIEEQRAAKKQHHERESRRLLDQMPGLPKAPALPSAGTNKQHPRKIKKAKSRRQSIQSEPSQAKSTPSVSTRPKRKTKEQVPYTDEEVAAYIAKPLDHQIYKWRTETTWTWDQIVQLGHKEVKGIADVQARYRMMAAKHARGDYDALKKVSNTQANPRPTGFQTSGLTAEINQANARATGGQTGREAAAITQKQQQPRTTGVKATAPPAAIAQESSRPAGGQNAAPGDRVGSYTGALPSTPLYATQTHTSSVDSPRSTMPATPDATLTRTPARARKPKAKTALQHAASELLAQNDAQKQRDDMLVRLEEEIRRREEAERNVAEQVAATKQIQKQMEEEQKKAKKDLDEEQKNSRKKIEEENKKIKKEAEEEKKKVKKENEEEMKRLNSEIKEKEKQREKQYKRDLSEVRKEGKQALIEQRQKSSMDVRNAQLAAAARTRDTKAGRATGSGFSFAKNNSNNNNGNEEDEPQPATKPRGRVRTIKSAKPVVDILSDQYRDTAGKTVIDNDFLHKNWAELFTENEDTAESEPEELTPEQILEDDLTYFKYQVLRKTWSGDDEPEDEDSQVVICGDYFSVDQANGAAATEIFENNGQDTIYVAPNREYHIHSAPPNDDGLAQIHVEVPDGHIRVWVTRSLVSRYVGKKLPTLDPTAFHKRYQYLVKEETREADADPASQPTEVADVGLYSFLTLANSCAADRLVGRTFHTNTSRIEEVKARMSEARYDLNDKLDELKDKGQFFCEQRPNRKGQMVRLFVTKMEMKGPRN